MRRHSRRFVILILGWAALIPLTVRAADYYVASDGDDANPGTEALPWRTIQKAGNVMVAGDSVYVKEGTYFKDGICGEYCGIAPKNSGSDGKPITFKAYPGHKVIVDQNFEYAGFFVYDKSYITIEGFEIRRARPAGILTKSEALNGCSSCRVRGLVIQGNVIHDITAAAGSNAGAIRPDGANGAVIRNNYLYNISEEGAAYRGAGILSYDLWDSVVEHNEIWNTPDGIMYKRQFGDLGQVTRYNYIHDVSNIAIRFNTAPPSYAAGTTYGAVNHTVHNNIIYRAKTGISLWECDDAVSRDNKFYNNTIVDTPRSVFMPLGTIDSPAIIETTQFWNNILYNTVDGGSQWDTVLTMVDKPSFVSLSDYNDFYETSPWLPFAWNKETLLFEQYRTNSGLDGHSVFADPLFVDKANHDFRLQPDSPAHGTGLGGVNMGAYATGDEIIGPVIGADTLAPAAPTNLNVQ